MRQTSGSFAAAVAFGVPERLRQSLNMRFGHARVGSPGGDRIAREVRHELVMLPYGLFDNLSFRVDGGAVTLVGEVTRSALKSGAGNVVKRIEGVDRVNNDIQVLPLSPSDERIRLRVYRAVYGQPVLNRYALSAVPPIHIVVENGNVSLEGAMASDSGKNIAGLRANSVPGGSSVNNGLQVDGR